MNDKKPSLYEKIQLVSNEIRNITKDMIVGTGAYAYKAVSDLDVTLAVKDAETKYKLLSVPMKQELISSEVLKAVKKDGNEGFTYVDTVKMTVRIFDLESEATIDIESFGKGIDSGDKGFGKAATYARKYALLNAYKIATGEDPDANKSEQQTAPKNVSEKRVAISNYLSKNIETQKQLCAHFNVAELADLNEKQINQIFKTYTEKNLL